MNFLKPGITVLFTVLSFLSYGQNQPTVEFNLTNLTIEEPNANETLVSIQVNSTGGKFLPENFQVKDTKRGSATSTLDYEFGNTKEYTLIASPSSVDVLIRIKSDKLNEINETILLEIVPNDSITVGTNGSIIVTIREIPDNKLVRLSTGVDFDFTNSNNSASFYGELNALIPREQGKVGFSMSLVTNTVTRIDSLLPTQELFFQDGGEFVSEGDTLIPTRSLLLGTQAESSFREVGMRLSPIYHLFRSPDGKNSLFIGGGLMGSRFTVNTTYNYDTLATVHDTLSILEFESRIGENRIRRNSNSYLYQVVPFGMVLYRYSDDNFDIQSSALLGLTRRLLDRNTGQYRPIYSIEASILEKRSGITIGGRIKNDISIGNQPPQMILYISKSFNFADFGF